ncbi:uncharacterized protein LOC108906104 [Anoplophora glabripennis]|uniref:uncharacterized protein LOC108906104 n=1 Tax=Anoplophora glabripennis TaxID=217634 RepID=UPI000874CE9B|nr:uncharacterized protein LOC108906104 [Anoplophora glabripennis]
MYQANTIDVINFLQSIYSSGQAKYGTFNSHRSAISLILNRDLANEPVLKRFMKGISKLRPSQPRYDITWDPNPLLKYLASLPRPYSFQDLSSKLVTLLALITGGRLQTTSLIRVSNVMEHNKEIQIAITDPIKTSGTNRPQPTLHIPFFKEKPALCCASALKEYIDRTTDFRGQQDFMFLTYKKPHARATKQSLSRWVKTSLANAGIDVLKFKPHSIRHCSSSAALRQGVSLELICQTVGWSGKSGTFAKFYNRPIAKNTDYAKAILSIK